MLADGIGPRKVAEELGVVETTVHRWLKMPEVMACYRKCLERYAMGSYAKAARKIDKQIDDPNPWVAQGAAREALTRFGPVVMGSEDKEIVVRVEGMPQLGVPDGDTADGVDE